MTCDERQEQLSRMVDGEPAAAEPGGLFGHLETCAECRAFLDALMRVRGAAREDRARLLREAEAVLPAAAPIPAPAPAPAGWRPSTAGPPRRGLFGGAVPIPAAFGYAALVLALGIAIGAGIALRVGGPRPPAPAVTSPERAPAATRVVYVCAMPEIQVEATPLP